MKKIIEYCKSLKHHPHIRKTLMWKIIDCIEKSLNLLYKIIVPFIPAIIFGFFGSDLLSFILFVAGFLRLIYSLLGKYSIKEIWLWLRWKRYGK